MLVFLSGLQPVSNNFLKAAIERSRVCRSLTEVSLDDLHFTWNTGYNDSGLDFCLDLDFCQNEYLNASFHLE